MTLRDGRRRPLCMMSSLTSSVCPTSERSTASGFGAFELREPRLGPNSASSGRVWPYFGRCGPSFTGLWPTLGPYRPILAEVGQRLAKGWPRCWPDLGQPGPFFVDVRRMLAKFGQHRRTHGQTRPTVERGHKLDQLGQNCLSSGRKLALFHNLGQFVDNDWTSSELAGIAGGKCLGHVASKRSVAFGQHDLCHHRPLQAAKSERRRLGPMLRLKLSWRAAARPSPDCWRRQARKR